MPSENKTIQKAFKDGVISKGQYEKMNDGLLLGIIKKKRKGMKSSKTRVKSSKNKGGSKKN